MRSSPVAVSSVVDWMPYERLYFARTLVGVIEPFWGPCGSGVPSILSRFSSIMEPNGTQIEASSCRSDGNNRAAAITFLACIVAANLA